MRRQWCSIPVLLLILLLVPVGVAGGSTLLDPAGDNLVFIHHSSGTNWLSSGLHEALLAKDYVGRRDSITYGTVVAPDPGRPGSLGDVPGDHTDMQHWILWFNDYLAGVKNRGVGGANRIIMFKSCFPISSIGGDGVEPGDPFSGNQTVANYKAIYRHATGPGNTYLRNGAVYSSLEDVFAANPDTLFIPVTAPPLAYGETNNADAHRARAFNYWLKNDWLSGYNAAHPGLKNVAVFDWFDVLANPEDFPTYPNRLKAAYGGQSGDSHPNPTANASSTRVFATDANNFIDNAWATFRSAAGRPSPTPTPFVFQLGFRALAEQIPEVVGEPTENEHWGAKGDSVQRTTKGLVVWRKADNWTAFTNGSRTWINGPYGVQDRSNDERFAWEVP